MSTDRKNLKKGMKKNHAAAIVLISLAVLSSAILTLSVYNKHFASFFNRNIGGAIRCALAFLTNALPFSLAELLLLLLPIFITLLIIYTIKNKKGVKSLVSYVILLFSALSLVFSLFVFSYGTGYHTPSLYERFDIQNKEISLTELKATAKMLIKEVNSRSTQISYSEDGSSTMPFSLDEMNTMLSDAYKNLSYKYDFIQGFKSRVKPVMMSVPMSYTHTTGIYTFFTGEANLNVDFPDYNLPFTAAHEMAHQRGIARENEANFVAFLACLETKNSYFEYCAYLNMFEYVASALYNADPSGYSEIYSLLSPAARAELFSYVRFFNQYKDSKASSISSAINNAYLVANGEAEGSKSYGLVVNLAVMYFNSDFDEK